MRDYVCFAYSCTLNLVMMQIFIKTEKCAQVEFVHVAAVNQFLTQLVQNCCLSLLDGVVS